MSPLLLAFDIGTSSTRTALFDMAADRVPRTTAQESYSLITSADGAAEIEPAALRDAAMLCLEHTLRVYRDDPKLRGRRIVAVSASCFWHSLIGCDAAGAPLTRIITWADARCRDDAARLRAEHSEKQTHALTGCMMRSSFWPAKLAWLRRTQRRLFTRVAQWMSPAEWLQLTLCGQAHCAIGMATGTGLFDPTRLAWSERMLAMGQLDAKRLRPLSDEPAIIGGRLATQFPELKGVPWFPAIGDGAASNLGSGATRPGLAAINVGTSAAIRIMREGARARAPFGLFCYRVDARRFLVGGAVSNAGNLRAWCLRELKLPAESAIEEELAARPGPTHGLAVLPFWTAERAPTWDEEQTGLIHGLTQHTTALDLLQAITEATYHRIARIAGMILAEEESPPKFIVSGGIQKSAGALQRFADVLARPVYPNDELEASIRGSAIYALEKLGYPAPPAQFGAAVRPRAKWARAYAAEGQRQRAIEKLMASARERA